MEDDRGDDKGDDKCSICVTELTGDIARCPRSHWFHRRCIASWHKINQNCPMCREYMYTPRDRNLEWNNYSRERKHFPLDRSRNPRGIATLGVYHAPTDLSEAYFTVGGTQARSPSIVQVATHFNIAPEYLLHHNSSRHGWANVVTAFQELEPGTNVSIPDINWNANSMGYWETNDQEQIPMFNPLWRPNQVPDPSEPLDRGRWLARGVPGLAAPHFLPR